MIPTVPKIPRDRDNYDATLHQDLYKELAFLRGAFNGLPQNSQPYYTPTLSNNSNLASSTAYQTQYIKIGGMVIVFGQVDGTPTVAGTVISMGLSFPIPSAITAASQCAGVVGFGNTIRGGRVYGDTTNHRATLDWVSGSGSQTGSFIFAYWVI